MLKKIYCSLRRSISKPEERGELSSGFWPNIIREKTLDICRDYKGMVLEIGCGEGLFLAKLAKNNPLLKIYAIDNSREKIKKTENRIAESNIKNVEVIFANAIKLPFGDKTCDAVIAINLFLNLRSFNDVERVIVEMGRVCKPNGKIIFEIRNSLNPLINFMYKFAKYYDYTAKDAPFKCYRMKHIIPILLKNNFTILREIHVGFFIKALAPVIIIEAEKRG